MAEVVKIAAVRNVNIFEVLETRSHEIRAALFGKGDMVDQENVEAQTLLMQVVLGSVMMKAQIIAMDEHDNGLRGLLDFGHTNGHAIGAITSPDLLHRECVSIGCVLDAKIARHLGHLSQASVNRLVRYFDLYDLPTSLTGAQGERLTASQTCMVDELMHIMSVNKKTVGQQKG